MGQGYTAEYVCSEVGISRRQLNRWTSCGAMRRPNGKGRWSTYDEGHVREARRIKAILNGDAGPRNLIDIREARAGDE